MNKQEFQHARRVARTFHSLCSLGVAQVNDSGDLDILNGCSRWMKAEFEPLQAAGVDMAALWVDTCRGPSSGAFGPSLAALRQHPEEKRRWLSYFRLRRMGIYRAH